MNGGAILLGYDNDGLLTQAGSLVIDRDPQNGRVSGTTLGTLTTTHGYNGFGELNSFSASYGGSSLYNASTTYNKLGSVTQVTETIGGQTDTVVYGYDELGRLTAVTRNGVAQESYTYDDNGNRILANGVTATFDDQDRLSSFGATTYTHTENGERRTKTSGVATTTYTHDALGNLVQVSLPNGTLIEYLLDGRQRRVGKKVNGILMLGFLYEDQLRPAAELDGTGAVVSRFVYSEKANVPEYMIRGGNTYRIITDSRGSPRIVINVATGAIEQRMDYSAYGTVVLDTNPGYLPFGFAGGIYDRDTQLVHFGMRDYDAESGRWMEQDPIGFAAGDSNLYAYVTDNPVSRIDPDGLQGILPPPPRPVIVTPPGFQDPRVRPPMTPIAGLPEPLPIIPPDPPRGNCLQLFENCVRGITNACPTVAIGRAVAGPTCLTLYFACVFAGGGH